MRYSAALSFTDPPGLRYSALTAMVQPVASLSFFSRMRGVLGRGRGGRWEEEMGAHVYI